MDSGQLLLTIAITITTILVVLTGIQMLFALKELRRAIKKSGNMIWRLDKHQEKEPAKKDHGKKQATIHSVLDKIRILVPSSEAKNKRFFIKEK